MSADDPIYSASATPARPGLRAGLLRNLSGGLGLLLLRRLPPSSFERTFDQVVALLILNLMVWAGLDALHAETDSQLVPDGLFGWACYLLIGLFACAVLARAQSREADTRAVLIPTLAVAPFVLIVFWMSTDVGQVRNRPTLAMLVALVYLCMLSVRLVRGAFGAVRARTAWAAIGLVLVTPAVLQALDLDTRLWVPDEDEQTAAQSDDSGTEETLLYDQPGRIAAAVDRVTPEQPGIPGVYFVGFAGDGDQDIFKREALFAQQVFADHFGSGERSVELVNDVDDRDSYPLATVSGLQQTLKLLASRMNVNDDVLVLTLTSHGSREGLEVSNGNLPLLQLGPADLRQALDESGIRWRVLVVSACYSGVFLDSLKTDTTLIVTASDSEHSSFGCDDDRDLTYFGEAFLHDAIPSTGTLEQAFRKAAEIIQRREAQENEPHSNPQLFVGSQIREKLAELESSSRPAEHDQKSFTVHR